MSCIIAGIAGQRELIQGSDVNRWIAPSMESWGLCDSEWNSNSSPGTCHFDFGRLEDTAQKGSTSRHDKALATFGSEFHNCADRTARRWEILESYVLSVPVLDFSCLLMLACS